MRFAAQGLSYTSPTREVLTRNASMTETAVATESLPLSISASAARRLHKVLGGDAGAALRISVKGGGCSGFQYAFDIEKTRAEDDLVVTRDGASVIVDPVSLEMIKGSRTRLRRRPDGPGVQGEEPERGRVLRMRGELYGVI